MNGYRIRIRNLLILLISYEKRGKILRALSISEMARTFFKVHESCEFKKTTQKQM